MQKALFLFLFQAGIATAVFAQEPPPPSTKPDVLVTLKGDTLKNAGHDSIYTRVEIESDFPGGLQAWLNFLQANLKYPQKAIRKEIQGTVVLEFIVCTDGTVCNMAAISGPPELRKAALDAIKKTPMWIPANQDGKAVKSYKRQPITFRL